MLLAASIQAQIVSANKATLEQEASILHSTSGYNHHPVPWSGTYEKDYEKGSELFRRIADQNNDSGIPAASTVQPDPAVHANSSPTQPSANEISDIDINQNFTELLQPGWLMLLVGLVSCIGAGAIASRFIGSRVNKASASYANLEQGAVDLETKISIVQNQYANQREVNPRAIDKTSALKVAPVSVDGKAPQEIRSGSPLPPPSEPRTQHPIENKVSNEPTQSPQAAIEVITHGKDQQKRDSSKRAFGFEAKQIPPNDGVKKHEDLRPSFDTTEDTKRRPGKDLDSKTAPETKVATPASSPAADKPEKAPTKKLKSAPERTQSIGSTTRQKQDQPRLSLANAAKAGKAVTPSPATQTPSPKVAAGQTAAGKVNPAEGAAKEKSDTSQHILQLINDFEGLVNTTENALQQDAFGEISRRNIVKAIEKATKLIKSAYINYSAEPGSEQLFTKAIKKASRVITKALEENLEEESARLKLKVNE